MKNKTYILILIISCLAGCQAVENENKDERVIIDITKSIKTKSIFGEGVISTALYERDMAISPQLNEIFYTLGDYKQKKRCLVGIAYKNGHWTKPEILNMSGEYQDIEPFLSDNGNKLYFASDRPIFGDTSRKDYNIWYCNRDEGLWSKPIALDSIINTRKDEFYPSLSNEGNLYFTATRENGVGKEDIFISKEVDGKFQTPNPLPSQINSPSYEFNAFISPDEDYIIFSSFGREDGLGGGDLYISEKDSDGNWGNARNLGKKINSDKLDYCPFVHSGSKKLYFTSESSPDKDGKLKTVEDLKEIANSTGNGFGDIYTIDFSELEINGK